MTDTAATTPAITPAPPAVIPVAVIVGMYTLTLWSGLYATVDSGWTIDGKSITTYDPTNHDLSDRSQPCFRDLILMAGATLVGNMTDAFKAARPGLAIADVNGDFSVDLADYAVIFENIGNYKAQAFGTFNTNTVTSPIADPAAPGTSSTPTATAPIAGA